jgi:cAMP-specific phosphodiesterase 4
MATLSKLAIRYHDRSVLEQHHAALTFKILKEDAVNITANLSIDDSKYFRRMVISNILATDMKDHFDLIKMFESRYKETMDKGEEFRKTQEISITQSNISLNSHFIRS